MENYLKIDKDTPKSLIADPESILSGNNSLSELDKVQLNCLWPPIPGESYTPELVDGSGLYYCQRAQTVYRNGKVCEPCDSPGPNCTSCRVFESPKS